MHILVMIHPRFLFACLTCIVLLPMYAAAETLETLCVVRELDEVDVPAKRDGVIGKLIVRRGDRVQQNQLIASLENTDLKLRLNVAKSSLALAIEKSKDESNVQIAETAVRRAQTERQLVQELGRDAVYLEKFRMQNSWERAIAELTSSKNLLRQSLLELDVKRNEAQVLENAIAETIVNSPVTGVVLELKRQRGEWVKQGEPILTVTRMDRLQAEGFLDTGTTSVNAIIGSTATVTFQIGGRKTYALEGLVAKQAAPKLEMDGKFPVWVEFDNIVIKNANGEDGWLIRPGMRASMSIAVEPSSSDASLSMSGSRKNGSRDPSATPVQR